MSIESRFDVPFISALALREKAIQQNYRPIIAVHKWFARRPGTLFRGLILSEFIDSPLSESFFRSNQLEDKTIADPFMGGGTPLIEANRLGATVIGWDINPMAWWIVGRELEHLDLNAYADGSARLLQALKREVGPLYDTACLKCGDTASVKYVLWVKTQPCVACFREIDLFPGYLIAKDARHPLNVLVCPGCGDLNEVADRTKPGSCATCRSALVEAGPARRGQIICPHCETKNTFPNPKAGPPAHRMFAIEYHCVRCKPSHEGRFFKRPDADDLARYQNADARWRETDSLFVPDERIPPGDESTRLHRWGYDLYRQMFNERQLLGLELSCRVIAAEPDERVRDALATNLSDLLRYNNMLVRYDTMALKALDLFSVHGFPVGLVRCESNLVGIRNASGKPVGSGGWVNMVEKYTTAKAFCDRPFEVPASSSKKVYTSGEWIGDRVKGAASATRIVDLRCGSSTDAAFEVGSLNAVFTDPPYYDSVQYAELMDFCYVWLRKIARDNSGCFNLKSTRNVDELTGNETEGRGIEHFTEGLSNVYSRMAAALIPGAPLVFTYHHNRISAYHPVAVALLDAGLVATAAIPCPAEMGGSIHISGTASSIVDTVFVCRSEGSVSEAELETDAEGIARVVSLDVAKLRAGGVQPTPGDTRCLIFGHLTRLVIWHLRDGWDPSLSAAEKLARVAAAVERLASVEEVRELVRPVSAPAMGVQVTLFDSYADRAEQKAVSFRGLVRGVAG